jgi:hypothetical protein
MTLIDVVRDLDTFDNEGIICATKPWCDTSHAIVIVDPNAQRIPPEAEKLGMDYFLDIFIAREFMEDWMLNLDTTPTLQEKCSRLIHYAIYDA